MNILKLAAALVALLTPALSGAQAQAVFIICDSFRPSERVAFDRDVIFVSADNRVVSLEIPSDTSSGNTVMLMSSMVFGTYRRVGDVLEMTYASSISPGVRLKGIRNEVRFSPDGRKLRREIRDGKTYYFDLVPPRGYRQACFEEDASAPAISGIRETMMREINAHRTEFGDRLYGSPQPPVVARAYRYEPSTTTLKGTLAVLKGTSPNDKPVQFHALLVDQAITVLGDPSNLDSPTEAGVDRLHLVVPDELWPSIRKLTGAKVTLTGTLFHADNGNHQTKVLMNVIKVSQ